MTAPLYGHTSQDTAYLVDDYPYGRTVRCRIRYWMEHDARKGWRFCSQTEHPKNLRWNAPKRSTYAMLGMCMYLDENNHVQCARLTEFSSAVEVASFVERFPGYPRIAALAAYAGAMRKFLADRISGETVWVVNGKPQQDSAAERERMQGELGEWSAIVDAAEARTAREIAGGR